MDQKKMAPGRRLGSFSDGFTVDGPLGSRWTGSTWTVSGGKAINTPVTLGADVLINGGFETPYVAGLANGWTKSGTPTVTEETTIVHGGTSSQKVDSPDLNTVIYQIKATTAGLWYLCKQWVYKASGAGLVKALGWSNNAQIVNVVFSDASWTLVGSAIRHSSGSIQLDARAGGAGAAVYYMDDFSAQAMTTSELVATVDSGTSNATVSVNVTLGDVVLSRYAAGVVACLDSVSDPKNFLIAHHNGGVSIFLDKCVNGTYTNLITSIAAPYVAGATMTIKKYGSYVALYYNGTQVGITQIVTDASIINNTRHGMFSTHSGNTLDNFSITPTSFLFADLFATALDPAWTGATWSVSSGAAINTPTLGSNVLTNGGFEGTYVAGVAPNYTLARGTPSEYVADPHGGVSAQQLNNPAGNSGYMPGPATALAAGDWYQASMWAKALAGNGSFYIQESPGSTYIGSSITTAAAIWTELITTGRTLGGNYSARMFATTNASADANQMVFDDVSVKPLTASSLFASVNSGLSDVTVSVNLTGSTFAQHGLVVCLDSASSPANFLIGYLGKTFSGVVQVFLDKCVGGTYTNLVAANVTYAAGAPLKIVKSGTSVSIYYNGTIVGTTQTVSDASIINNTKHGMFSTYSGLSLDNFSIG